MTETSKKSFVIKNKTMSSTISKFSNKTPNENVDSKHEHSTLCYRTTSTYANILLIMSKY